MRKYFENLAKALLGQSYSDLDSVEQKVIDSIGGKTTLSENINQSFHDSLTLGQRVADSVAKFGGSWTFIGIFFSIIIGWICINSVWLITGEIFDPYPTFY